MTTVEEQASSRTGTLLHKLRRTPLFRHLVPMEALMGWPIPVRRLAPGGMSVYLQLLLYGQQRPARRGEPTTLLAPFAVVTLERERGIPVEWADARFRNLGAVPGEPVGSFPHDAVRDLPLREYLARRAELLGLYDELFDAMAADTEFLEYQRFVDLLAMLVEPPLLPAYRALSPRFVEQFAGPDRAGQ
jgi:hypothetical protein